MKNHHKEQTSLSICEFQKYFRRLHMHTCSKYRNETKKKRLKTVCNQRLIMEIHFEKCTIVNIYNQDSGLETWEQMRKEIARCQIRTFQSVWNNSCLHEWSTTKHPFINAEDHSWNHDSIARELTISGQRHMEQHPGWQRRTAFVKESNIDKRLTEPGEIMNSRNTKPQKQRTR